jgi:hypothetical protein
MAELCPGILWAILWFLGLWFVGWPVGYLLAWLYVLLLPFSVCIEPLKETCEAILKLVQLPLFFTEKMMKMEPCGGGGS